MVLDDGSPETLEATGLVDEWLAAWAACASSGMVDLTWQPLATAPHGATRVAERATRALAWHQPVKPDATEASTEEWWAIA